MNRGILFIDYDFETPETASGIRVNSTGGISMVEGERAVHQAIYLLLSTIPGERVMRPEYGCDLYKLIFSPNDDTTAGLAMHFVRRALERWEPRIEIVRLDTARNLKDLGTQESAENRAGLENRSHQLYITVAYKIKPSQQTHQLIYPFDLEKEHSDVVTGS